MNGVVQLQISQFLLIYLLLLGVSLVLKLNKVNQSAELIISSLRMSLQLVIAGLILTYIFENPHPLYTVGYILMMIIFSIRRVYKKCPEINRKFKYCAAFSISSSGIFVLIFFVKAIIGESIFSPQFTIPLSGMLIGNSMTGVILGINHFSKSLKDEKPRITSLINIGVHPKKILKPMVKRSLEMAFIPSLNSMVGMGVISLPGMMTGQILAGTSPFTAILYQIAITIAICSTVILTSFLTLHLGYHTMYDKEMHISI